MQAVLSGKVKSYGRLLLVALAVSVNVLGQSTTGTMSGNVVDSLKAESPKLTN